MNNLPSPQDRDLEKAEEHAEIQEMQEDLEDDERYGNLPQFSVLQLSCAVCKFDDFNGDNLLVTCGRCRIVYHQRCHDPPLPASVFFTFWRCDICRQWRRPVT